MKELSITCKCGNTFIAHLDSFNVYYCDVCREYHEYEEKEMKKIYTVTFTNGWAEETFFTLPEAFLYGTTKGREFYIWMGEEMKLVTHYNLDGVDKKKEETKLPSNEKTRQYLKMILLYAKCFNIEPEEALKNLMKNGLL